MEIPDQVTRPDLEDCPGCNTPPGDHHDDDCDHARCPGCGAQLLLHDCGDSDRPARWHGIHPADDAAYFLGWFYVHPSPGKPIVPDEIRASVSCQWNPDKQHYDLPEDGYELSVRWDRNVDYATIRPYGYRDDTESVNRIIAEHDKQLTGQEGTP